MWYIRNGNAIEWRGIVISRWRGGYHTHHCGFRFQIQVQIQIQIQIQTQGYCNISIMHTQLNCVFDAVMRLRRRRRRRRRRSDCQSSRRGKRRTQREETISTDLAKRLTTWTSPSASVPASSIPFSPAIFSAKIVSLILLSLTFYAQFFSTIIFSPFLSLVQRTLCSIIVKKWRGPFNTFRAIITSLLSSW